MLSRVLTPVILCLATAAHAQTFLVNDTFDDGNRSNQNAPNSLQWFYGAHHNVGSNAFASLDASSGKLVLDHHSPTGGGSFATTFAYFTESGSPLTLDIGETLRLSFDVSFVNGNLGSSSNGFRWALFDSGGVRVTEDFAGANETGVSRGTSFSGWTGYEALLPVSSSLDGNFLVRERNKIGNGLFTSSNWTGLSSSSVAEPNLVKDITYSGFLELTRSASGITIVAGMDGVTTNAVLDSETPRFTFDTVAFFVLDTVPTDVVLDNIQLTVVPEPSSTLVALAGAAVLGGTRRRRKK